MGPKERRQREREEIRSRILDAAREMFATEGYEAVTMRRIAEKIEYSPTAIYFHFRDKETLIRELCDCDFRMLAFQFHEIARIDDPIERLRATGRAYARFGLENPNQYRLMFMTPHPPLDPETHSIERGNPEEDAYAFLKGTVADAIARGLFGGGHDDVELLSQTIWAAVHGVISLQIAKHNDEWVDWKPFEARVDSMIDIIIAGLSRETAATAKPAKETK
ncbi:MAG TPA: TetR/AcrR family transcriptional regulator [Thermoanaerobaculia bacterium]|nr:TetR/AcrR family transcriptional regulator [Thermoanaerobaculia bacterium]